jgi:hypothetical protein
VCPGGSRKGDARRYLRAWRERPISRAKTLPRSHLTQIDQMKDSPIA